MTTCVKLAILGSYSSEPVYTTTQNFSWKQTTGELPHICEIKVPRVIAKELNKLQNPVTITAEVVNTHGEASITIENLYIIEYYIIDDFEIVFRIADCRWLFQGKKVTREFNVTLMQNSNVSAIKDIPQTNEPVELLKPFETLLSGRYAPHSVLQDGTMPKPFTLGKITEILIRSAANESEGKIHLLPFTVDNTMIVDNVIYDCVDLPNVIRELLSYGRLGLSVTLKGDLYLYSLLSFTHPTVKDPIQMLKDTSTISGCIFKTEKRRARPKAVSVLYEKYQETLVVATEETRDWARNRVWWGSIFTKPATLPSLQSWYTAQYIAQRRAIGCINVIPLPFPIYLPNNVTLNVGEYVPINDFLFFYGLRSNILNEPGFFSDLLSIKIRNSLLNNAGYLGGETGYPIYILADRIANTLVHHYQQTFMIDPHYIPHIKSWDARKCSIINNYDGKHAPSSVFGDYTFIPYTRSPQLMKLNPDFYNYSFAWEAYSKSPLLKSPSPALVKVLSKSLGVFRIEYVQPIDLTVAHLIPHNLNALPDPVATSKTPALIMCYPKKEFNMAAILSIVWRTDNEGNVTKKKFYSVQSNASSNIGSTNNGEEIVVGATADSEFPIWYIMSKYDYARYVYKPPLGADFNLVDKVTSKNVLSNLNSPPVNEDFLVTAAKYETQVVYTDFNDRYNGSVNLAGMQTQYSLIGNLSCIEYVINSRHDYTTLTFTDNVPFISEVTAFSQRELDFLRRQINRAGEITYEHTTGDQ